MQSRDAITNAAKSSANGFPTQLSLKPWPTTNFKVYITVDTVNALFLPLAAELMWAVKLPKPIQWKKIQ